MKKLLVLIAFVLTAVFAGNALAASSVAWSSYSYTNPATNQRWIQIVAVVTCHTDGTFTTSALYLNEGSEAAGTPFNAAGYYLSHVDYFYGATAPLDNSDFYLREHSSTGKDKMGLAGENQIDNATNHYGIKPLIDSLPSFAPFYGIPYLAISNNNVNGATFTLIFNFIQ